MLKDKAQEKEKMVKWWSKWWKEKKWDYSGDLVRWSWEPN